MIFILNSSLVVSASHPAPPANGILKAGQLMEDKIMYCTYTIYDIHSKTLMYIVRTPRYARSHNCGTPISVLACRTSMYQK